MKGVYSKSTSIQNVNLLENKVFADVTGRDLKRKSSWI